MSSLKATGDRILLAHGGGGSLAGDLVRQLFLPAFAHPALAPLGDSAIIELDGQRLAFTTDGYVVSPPFFPGGDIGTLAVAGTVNDLAVAGARPRFLSCSFIIEEGFPLSDLERIVESMARTAMEAGVGLVTGDTKVVERGAADGLFVITAGVGELREFPAGWGEPRPGDAILVNGTLGDHGFTVLAAREGLDFATGLCSDCAPLNGLIEDLFTGGISLRFLRDPTRGGIAAILNELVAGAPWGIVLTEDGLPLAPGVRALSEILGIDPLHVANEGKVVAIVAGDQAGRALEIMHDHPLGTAAQQIGRVEEHLAGLVTMETGFGRRIIDMPLGEQLPRIC